LRTVSKATVAGAFDSDARKGSVLEVYPGFSHGMCTIKKAQINTELLAFFKP
jgi:hypothetical protein